MSNDPRYQIIESTVKNWSLPTLTNLGLKESLRSSHPQYYWAQEFVSTFMMSTDYDYTDNGTYRTYHITVEPMYRSESKGLIPISSMNPVHIKNALLKNYSSYDVDDILSDEDGTLFHLLKAYMTSL